MKWMKYMRIMILPKFLMKGYSLLCSSYSLAKWLVKMSDNILNSYLMFLYILTNVFQLSFISGYRVPNVHQQFYFGKLFVQLDNVIK
jgi:hypothetical protein